MPDRYILAQYRSLPLEAKIVMSQNRIKEWHDYFDGMTSISFSGGKDSTVLADIAHKIYPEIPLVFSNTGLEYPEIQKFARDSGAIFVHPKMQFSEVISKYGYPIISKETAEAISVARLIRNGSKWTNGKREELKGERIDNGWKDWRKKSLLSEGNFKKSIYNKQKWLPVCNETDFLISNKCCSIMKKQPLNEYQKQTKSYPILATLAEESKLREQKWIKYGCNAFDAVRKISQPMSFWTEQDVLMYIVENKLEIASVYGDIVCVDKNGMQYPPDIAMQAGCHLKCTGCQRTGCIFCGFGFHLEKGETRFQRLAKTHPKQYEYCLGGGQYVDNPKYDATAPEYEGNWKNWNPKKIWVPSKKGLGMKKVFDECNAIYGKDFMRYE